MRSRSRRLPLLLPVLLLGALFGNEAPQARGAGAPANPFFEAGGALHAGPFRQVGGLAVLPVTLPAWASSPLPSHVGFEGSGAEAIDLPGLVGEWHVRVRNPSRLPLYLPAGDTLLSPTRPSRSVDRPLWIPPGGATFVPVVQAAGDPPPGPYLSRGRGLTPREVSRIPHDLWLVRVRSRNRYLGVPADRLDDAGAGYATDAFAAIEQRLGAPLDAAVLVDHVTGVVVVTDRGPTYAHVELDPQRFRQLWPFLRAGLLLDAALDEDLRVTPNLGNPTTLRQRVDRLFERLRETPVVRGTFGEGWEYDWRLGDADPGHWEGLALGAGPVSVTLFRRGEAAPAAPTGGSTAGGEQPWLPDRFRRGPKPDPFGGSLPGTGGGTTPAGGTTRPGGSRPGGGTTPTGGTPPGAPRPPVPAPAPVPPPRSPGNAPAPGTPGTGAVR